MDADKEIPPLEYGQHFNQTLCERLERHFQGEADAESQGKRALVVGLFGEWGSGKSLHLRHIQRYFHDRAVPDVTPDPAPPSRWARLFRGPASPPDPAPQVDALTFPVFFNAWRYEAEEHLIVPLLKCAQHQLQQWQRRHETRRSRAWDWIKQRTTAAADSAIALSYGFKGKLNIPLFGEMSFDPSRIVEADKKRRRQREAEAQSYIDRLGSRYYDFEHQIGSLTGRGTEGPNLNLLFLIDDLDRCLPEKAVQMLESIKLFLDVEGCAFVLALDDEVVERGIAHRYRDYSPSNNDRALESIAYSLQPRRYREFCGEQDHENGNPVTGHEYLEKIVQLPVRIPAPTQHQVEAYLSRHFSHLFGEPEELK